MSGHDTSHRLSDALAATEAYLTRYVAYPSKHAPVAHLLWVAHAHVMEAWDSTPRLAFLSPEPASGKSRALEITETLVPRPLLSVNVTPAYLFRKVSDPDGAPTVLYDEIDTVFGPKARDNEEIRGLLNAGHRRGATAGRCVMRGKVVETEELPAYCAVAMAGLGDLPDTILTRSVIVRMRRRRADEHVAQYRRRDDAPVGEALRDALSDILAPLACVLDEARPEMPPAVQDRDADVWEPLLAIADLAGGDWPARAREAAVAMVSESRNGGRESLGVALLRDLRTVFGDAAGMEHGDIVERLNALDESPWGELNGTGLTTRKLSRLLGKYEIKSKVVKVDGNTVRGYHRDQLADAWARYCGNGVTEVTESGAPNAGAKQGNQSLGGPPYGSVTSVTSVTSPPDPVTEVTEVTEVTRLRGGHPEDALIDEARAGTGLTREQANELLRHDLGDLLEGRLTVAAARHFLENCA